MLVQSFLERLRPLVGIKSWDYIVLWKLSNDHRCIELMDCCCAGSENTKNGGEELIFEESCFVPSCRDCIFPHPRIKTCDLLQHLPSSIPLTDHSGVHAQTLLSNHPVWLNYSSDPSLTQEAIGGTRVLIPLSLGLLELFVTKQDVPEDEQLIDFIMSQCNFYLQEQAHHAVVVTMSNNNSDSFSSDHPNNNNKLDQHQHLPQDISIDRIHLCNTTTSPLINPLQQFINTETNINNGIFSEDQSTLFTPLIDNGLVQQENRCGGGINEATEDDHHKNECENNRSDESDPNDDEYDAKYRRRTGKGPQSKNLRAERRRRKKLNDRLYALRALVPNISKLDRASILGDAIDYVNELKKQADDLQMELEDKSDNEDHAKRKTGKDESDQMSFVQENGSISGKNKVYKHNHDQPQDNTNDKVQQMEPQVQVFQVEGNEFFVKVFCEHKSGGFVRLMEALNSLGLEVTNVNTTRHTCLVSTIFKVEQKNNDAVQADHVKESLLELTRNPSRMWPNNAAAATAQAEQGGSNNNNDNVYRAHHDHGHHHSLLHSRHINAHHLQH